MSVLPLKWTSTISSIALTPWDFYCRWRRFRFISIWGFALQLLTIKVKSCKELLLSFCAVEVLVFDMVEEFRKRKHFIGNRHWVFDNFFLPLWNVSIVRRLSSNVQLFNGMWQGFCIFSLELVFVIIKRWVCIEFSETSFSSYININLKALHFRNTFRFILDFLSSSSSHNYFINEMSAKLTNEKMPIVGLNRLHHSFNEIIWKLVGFEEINRHFIALALSGCMGDGHIRRHGLIMNFFKSSRLSEAGFYQRACVSSFNGCFCFQVLLVRLCTSILGNLCGERARSGLAMRNIIRK